MTYRHGFWPCRAGWAAHELYAALSPEDFVSGKSMFPIAATSGSAEVNADVFGHWVSTVYITLAQVVYHLLEAVGQMTPAQ